MNKHEFLGRLTAALGDLPQEERTAAVKYYEEYFEEAGLIREPEILVELGDPEAVAQSILQDYSSPPEVIDPSAQIGQAVNSRQGGFHDAVYRPGMGAGTNGAVGAGQKAKTAEPGWRNFWNLPVWAVVLICICGAGVIIPAIASLFGVATGLAGVLLGLFVAVAAVLFSLVIVGAALIIGGGSSMVAGFIWVLADPAAGLLAMGIGLLLVGLGIVVMVLGIRVVSWFIPACMGWVRLLWHKIKKGLTKGGAAV